MSRGREYDYTYYNEDRKEAYIEYCKANKNIEYGVMERLFAYTRLFEERFGKDCCTFTDDQIATMYKEKDGGVGFKSRERLANVHSQLKLYTTWCKESNSSWVPDNINHYTEIKGGDLKNYVSKSIVEASIISRETLLAELNTLPNVCDRFTLLAIFEGICGPNKQELINLNLNDFFKKDNQWYVNLHYDVVDRKTQEIKETKERTIKVTNKLVDLAKDSAAQEYYISIRGNRDVSFSKGQDPNTVLKRMMVGADNETLSYLGMSRMIYSRISANLERINSNLNANKENRLYAASMISIMHSGILYMMKQIADENNISMLDVYYNNDYIKEIDKQYDTNLIKTKAVFKRKYEEIFDVDQKNRRK